MTGTAPGPMTRRADDGELEVVARRHQAALLEYAVKLTGDVDLAQDLVQETLLRVWNSAVTGTPHRSVRSRLMTVLHNLAVDAARHRAARSPEMLAGSSAELADLADAGPAHRPGRPGYRADPAQVVVDGLAVQQLLGPLQHAQRSVVRKLYVEGLSFTETARELGIPTGTVKSRNRQAVLVMRRVADAS